MIDLNEYNYLKQKIDKLKTQAERSRGALEQKLKELRTKFNCESIDEAVKLLKNLKEEATVAEKSYHEALEEFKRQWGDRLSEL